jgi:hypothetical protein
MIIRASENGRMPINSDINRFHGIVKQKIVNVMKKDLPNPEYLKMVSDDNPMHDLIFEMLSWGSDGTYVTPANAKYLREVYMLLLTLQSRKSFKNRIIIE